MKKIIEYKNEKFEVIDDKNISPNDHCNYCDFLYKCNEYIDMNEWFACGATFHANRCYLKKIE